jgi:hypothetical protein
MSENDSMSKMKPPTRHWQFGIRHLLTLTLVTALYSSAFAVETEDSRHLLLLVATFLVVGVLIGCNWAAWIGFLCGAPFGLAFWWYENSVERFRPQDGGFYLIVYTALTASVGMLVGFVWSLAARTRDGERPLAERQGAPRDKRRKEQDGKDRKG